MLQLGIPLPTIVLGSLCEQWFLCKIIWFIQCRVFLLGFQVFLLGFSICLQDHAELRALWIISPISFSLTKLHGLVNWYWKVISPVNKITEEKTSKKNLVLNLTPSWHSSCLSVIACALSFEKHYK